MILTSSAVKTEKFTADVAARLKTCDTIRTFCEGGWFFAYGSKGGKIIVKTHADSQQEYENLVGPSKMVEFTCKKTGNLISDRNPEEVEISLLKNGSKYK